MSEAIRDLLARRDYSGAAALLQSELAKYPKNVRMRLQYAEALSGGGNLEDALIQYDRVANEYEADGLIVQAIGVRKKAEKVAALLGAGALESDQSAPVLRAPESPLFEELEADELDALVAKMTFHQYEEGDIIITEGEQGSALYVIVSGSVKVFTRSQAGENIHLAVLEAGEFFGEISVLTGRPRTATITAAEKSELLRLDKPDFDALAAEKPNIRSVVEEFYERRARHTVEAVIESLKGAR
ncbi:MAG: cyclic nucleotide-binding domain-containing protein [Acidobacteria bacterium]|nr:cyclic nucleotide-binding domain-containing protein [Acidobacteriota bacterium]